jgi:hypothetical protein
LDFDSESIAGVARIDQLEMVFYAAIRMPPHVPIDGRKEKLDLNLGPKHFSYQPFI